MSQSDSIDDEVKRLLAETGSDDSKESNKKDIKNKGKTWVKDGVEYNDEDTPDDEW